MSAPARRRARKADPDEVVRLREAGASLAAIAGRMGVSSARVSQILLERGLSRGPGLPAGEADRLRELVAQGLVTSAIARETGRSYSRVRSLCRALGLHPASGLRRRIDQDEIVRLRRAGMAVRAIAGRLGCGRGHVYAVLADRLGAAQPDDRRKALAPGMARRLRAMVADGRGKTEIMRDLGCSHRVVTRWLDELGLVAVRHPYRKADPDKIMRLREAGLSMAVIAERVGVSVSRVSQILQARRRGAGARAGEAERATAGAANGAVGGAADGAPPAPLPARGDDRAPAEKSARAGSGDAPARVAAPRLPAPPPPPAGPPWASDEIKAAVLAHGRTHAGRADLARRHGRTLRQIEQLHHLLRAPA